jgi:hypothetical protein
MNGYRVISLNYEFDYGRFDKPELQTRAKNTLGELFGFVRSTFDGLIEIGRVLQDFYYDCLASCHNGKKVFEEWLKSDDFGASRYIAKSAMEIYLWFEKLPSKVKSLVHQNVQKWSVSALRQLTKVSNDLVKELVSSGKKTALEVKREKQGGSGRERQGGSGREGQGGKNIEMTNSDSYTSEDTNYIPPLSHSSITPELAPGMRIIVTGDNYGWNGHRGIIICPDGDSWWVLLDHVVAQGLTTKKLYKPNQLEIEGIVENPDTKDVFTAIQVDQKIKEALAKRDEQQGLSAESTNIEIEASLEKTQQEKEELVKQLQAQESKLANLHALTVKNQQLEQRTAELEKKLEPLRQIQLAYEAEKAANSDLRKSVTSLQGKVQQLNNALLTKDQEIARLQAINAKQQQEIQRLSAVEVSLQQMRDREEKIVSKLGELGQRSGWKGWSSDGYKAADGSSYTGINAIAAFINDLNQKPSYQLSS